MASPNMPEHGPSAAAAQSQLPVVTEAVGAGRRLYRALPAAEFLSQLIAERDHLPPQRERRRAPVDFALDTYDSTTRHAVRRMPPGYRKTLVI